MCSTERDLPVFDSNGVLIKQSTLIKRKISDRSPIIEEESS